MKVSIVIPAYNEEKRIGKTLRAYMEYFDSLTKQKKLGYEILVVINNTKDKTEKVVKSFQKKNNKILYLNFKRGGKGFAVIEGFKDALKRKNDAVGFVDADMATSPEAYYHLIKRLEEFDGAIADRYMKGAKIFPAFSFRRIVVSRIFNFLVRTLFHFSYYDTQCGAKVFKRNVINHIVSEFTITQWAFDIDILYIAKKHGFALCSVPTHWTEKRGSKLNIIKTSIEMFFAIIQLRILRSPFARFLKIANPVVRVTYSILTRQYGKHSHL